VTIRHDIASHPPTASPARWLPRRGFVRIAVSAGLTPLVTASRSSAAPSSIGTAAARNDIAVIQLWLGGGPSHIDLYDLKPDAPREIRGPFRSIATSVPGLDVCELLPYSARVMDRLSVVRSLTHDTNDHVAGTHWMQTGHFGPTAANPHPTHPSAGSVAAKVVGSVRPGMLPYVHIRPDLTIDLYTRQFGSAHWGPADAPFDVKVPFPFWNPKLTVDVPNMGQLPGLETSRIHERVGLMRQLESLHTAIQQDALAGSLDARRRQALDLLSSDASRTAFDLSLEAPRVREAYGNNVWGQGALLCRRLVEAGARFVTLNTDSSSNMWDHHGNLQQGLELNLPAYDRLLTALVDDLQERGLFDRVIVFVCGEFGRTPRFNERGGRDHWGKAGFALLGGGGLPGGLVIGSTTANGEEPLDRPLSPGDLLATIYARLGVDNDASFPDLAGRPIPVLSHGAPIAELA
jgi:hypothetical protein